MKAKITEFRGDYAFLSNFQILGAPVHAIHPCGKTVYCTSVESAYQASKCSDPNDMDQFSKMMPRDAKQKGRKVKMMPGFDFIKDDIMHDLVYEKFRMNSGLMDRLIATGDAELIEGNNWGDTYWGVDLRTGKGENHLGKILMKVRDELKKEFGK